MSPTSYQTAPPRVATLKIAPLGSRPFGEVPRVVQPDKPCGQPDRVVGVDVIAALVVAGALVVVDALVGALVVVVVDVGLVVGGVEAAGGVVAPVSCWTSWRSDSRLLISVW